MASNPWLTIPLEDYESHMSLPSVGQSSYLAGVLRRWADSLKPSSVAIPGCAGGNGFNVLSSSGVRRVVGIDINAAFLDAVRKRYSGMFHTLELLEGDINSPDCVFEPVEFIFAALIIEYVKPDQCLERLRSLVTAGGRVGVILQNASPDHAAVTPSPYSSQKSLEGMMTLVQSGDFRRLAAAAGFIILEDRQQTLETGKSFSEFLLACRL